MRIGAEAAIKRIGEGAYIEAPVSTWRLVNAFAIFFFLGCGAFPEGAVAFLAVNTLANIWFRAARLDLTQNGLYTISDGTRNVLRGLQEPVTLRFFYSAEQAANFPNVRAYAERIYYSPTVRNVSFPPELAAKLTLGEAAVRRLVDFDWDVVIRSQPRWSSRFMREIEG